MTLREFHNGLRILRGIDRWELEEAGVVGEPFNLPDDLRWIAFRDDPYGFFIRADDDTAAKLWSIIERRTKR
jgi:hypothetical protein